MEQLTKDIFSNFAVQMQKDVEYDNYSDTELINKWTSILLSLNNEFRNQTPKLTFKELYLETLLVVSDTTSTNDFFEAVPTGFRDLDRLLTGIPIGEFIIVAARPAMGKTAFLASVIANNILDKNEPIAYFSLENVAQNLLLRLMSNISELPYHSIVSKRLEDFEVNQLARKTKVLQEANLSIIDNCITLDSIITQAYVLVKEKGVKIIFIDYLQLIQLRGKPTREQEVAKICRELSAFAKKYNVAIVASSQLSRAVETRGGDKRPQLSDLRESGAIEEHADKVLFIHRPEYYAITEDAEGNSTVGMAEIIIAKNRLGAIDSAYLRFVRQFSSFRNDERLENYNKNTSVNYFTNIRSDEFKAVNISVVRGSKMNDIEEDPF